VSTRIAVAEDDTELRRALAEALRAEGYDVVEAADGAMLLALIQRASPAAVVTDLVMPGLGGKDVLQLRRGMRDHVPFVIITGAPERMIQDLHGMQSVAILRKPVPLPTLLATVAAMLRAAAPSELAHAVGTRPSLPTMSTPIADGDPRIEVSPVETAARSKRTLTEPPTIDE
jgi:DNA-binding response OmpR family regulator